jgi:anti-sigma regulatory factor (Ser/Thr protein kinase)
VSSDPGRHPGSPGQRPGAEADGPALVDQEFDTGSLYALRAAVAAHATAAGLSQDQVYDVVAAAHELAANTVRHGAGHGRIRLWADDRFLYCRVSDDGPPGSGGDSTQAGWPASWQTGHGHGLWLIGQVADDFTLDHRASGTTATATFAIASPGQPPDPGRPPSHQGTPPQ